MELLLYIYGEIKMAIWFIIMQFILIRASMLAAGIWHHHDKLDDKIEATNKWLESLDRIVDRAREVKIITGNLSTAILAKEWEMIFNYYKDNLDIHDMLGGNTNEDLSET